MTFEQWINFGIQQGWCGPPVCATHDGMPSTELEDAEVENGGDPCIDVVRLYEGAAVKAGVEANHSPTMWR